MRLGKVFVIQKYIDFLYYKKYNLFEVQMIKKIGRPKGDNNKDKVCTIRLDDSTLKRLEAYCKYMNIAKSEAVRDAINLLVSEDEIKSKEQ